MNMFDFIVKPFGYSKLYHLKCPNGLSSVLGGRRSYSSCSMGLILVNFLKAYFSSLLLDVSISADGLLLPRACQHSIKQQREVKLKIK